MTSRREEPLSTDPLKFISPGMDYHDGKLYYTYPAHRKVWTKKNKDAPEIPDIEHYLLVMSSDPDERWVLDKTTAHENGFAYPEMMVVNQNGWGGRGAERWHTQDDVDVEPWDIYQRIRALYVRHIEFADEMYYDLMALYVMATYVYKLFDSFPYIHFGGTKASGKSQNLRILLVIGFNASLSANMTAADLFRNIAGNPGVFGIDEAEDWRSERGSALLEVLRSGYKKGTTVSRQRQKPDGKFVPDKFQIYGPKVLASINPLDSTTASRSIKVAMEPAFRPIEDFTSDPTPHAALIDDLHYFGLANAVHIDEAYRRWTTERRQEQARGLSNRAWELAVPIVTMADYVASDTLVEPLIEWLTSYFEAEQKRDDSTDNIRTLALSLPSLLKDQPAAQGNYYPLKKVLENFREFADQDVTEKVTTRTVAKWLHPLGFKDLRADRGGKQVHIEEDDLRNALTKRHINPNDEDLQWLAGDLSYQHEEEHPEQEALEF